MKKQKRNENGTFGAVDSPRGKMSITLDESLIEKLKRVSNRSQYIEGLLLDKASELLLCGDEWDYFEQWEALQDLRLIVNHAIVKLCQHEEKTEIGDAEYSAIKEKITKWLETQAPIN